MDPVGTKIVPASRLVVREDFGGRVARIVFANPPDNAFDITLLSELNQTLDALAAWPSLGGVVLEGEGAHFSTGLSTSHRRPPYGDELVRSHLAAVRKLASLEALVFSVVRGRCFGAALELVTAGHFVFCSPEARFSLPDVNLGAFPLIAPLLLAERIGPTRADEWIASGRLVEPEEAMAAGLVTACPRGWDDVASFTDKQLEAFVLARPVASVRTLARALSTPRRERLERDLPDVQRLFEERIAESPEFAEGLSAALRNRPPRWS